MITTRSMNELERAIDEAVLHGSAAAIHFLSERSEVEAKHVPGLSACIRTRLAERPTLDEVVQQALSGPFKLHSAPWLW